MKIATPKSAQSVKFRFVYIFIYEEKLYNIFLYHVSVLIKHIRNARRVRVYIETAAD
jgi:hypothetical protein